MTSIILLCRNQWSVTKRCLDSVRSHTKSGSYELLVYDNDSTDKTWEHLQRLACNWPELKPTRNKKNFSFARAVNMGMRAAKGRAIMWLNSDTVVTPGWLEGLNRVLDADERIGGVGPYTDNMAPPYQISKKFKPKPNRDLDFLGGFCFLVRKEAVESVGLLDERFEWGWEDMDYCLRLRHGHWRLRLAGSVFVSHDGGRTMKTMPSPERRRTDLQNRGLILEKWLDVRPLGGDLANLFRMLGTPWENYFPDYSIVVPLVGPQRKLTENLERLRKSCEGSRYEVIVVDARERTLRAGPQWPQLRVEACPAGRSISNLLNQGVRASRGEIIVFFDLSTVAAKGWLAGLGSGRGIAPDIGAIGPVPLQGGPDFGKNGSRKRISVDFLSGGCFAVTRAALATVGEFDTHFKRAYWDWDYCLRLRQAGFRLVISPQARAFLDPVDIPGDRKTLLEKWATVKEIAGDLKRKACSIALS